LIKSAIILLLKERKIRELTLIATHYKWSFKSNVFMFYVVWRIPLQWLRHNFLCISVQKTTTDITGWIGTVKCVSQLPIYSDLDHKVLTVHKSKWITVLYNKCVIWLIKLVIIEPSL
jgi:hypothetical protein